MLLLLKQKEWKDYSKIHVHISLQLSTKIDMLIYKMYYERKCKYAKENILIVAIWALPWPFDLAFKNS